MIRLTNFRKTCFRTQKITWLQQKMKQVDDVGPCLPGLPKWTGPPLIAINDWSKSCGWRKFHQKKNRRPNRDKHRFCNPNLYSIQIYFAPGCNPCGFFLLVAFVGGVTLLAVAGQWSDFTPTTKSFLTRRQPTWWVPIPILKPHNVLTMTKVSQIDVIMWSFYHCKKVTLNIILL